MQIKLSFLGAARNVTGSRFLVESDGARVLVDCGLYQERPLQKRNWQRFPVKAKSINAALLTHAHLDHCGLLPRLVSEGFGGRIHCTAATAAIARIILLDSAHIQEEDAAYKKKRHRREGRKGRYPEVPLYTTEDALRVEPLFRRVPYGKATQVADGMVATFCDAGHVLGSSVIVLTVGSNGRKRTIVFSGDVGRRNMPILEDPTLIERADYVLIESTYGDRLHQSQDDVKVELAKVINETHRAGGKILIPSFALERSQDILYHLNELRLAGKIPKMKVFLDSPMAIRITEVFEKHSELFDEQMSLRVDQARSLFELPGLTMTRTTDESKAINRLKGPAIIIAGSGMCSGGRIKHHLANHISQEQNTVVFIGYQANGTLGRAITGGAEEVRIFGRLRPVRARIARVNGFSAHADRDGLLSWLTGLKTAPRRVFVVHGEAATAVKFGQFVRDKTGWDVSVPEYQEQFVLD